MSKATKNKFSPGCEALEDRTVPSSTSLVNGVLTVVGTAGNDNLAFSRSNGNLVLNDNGVIKNFSYAAVQEIRVLGRAGNDVITFSNDIFQRIFAFGEDGDDIMDGGGGANYLSGGNGNDTIYGDAGTSFIWGGSGSDLLGGLAGRAFYMDYSAYDRKG